MHEIATDGARVFVALSSGEVLSFDGITGQPGWSRGEGEALRLAANDRALVGVDPQGIVWGLNRETGDAEWKRPTDLGPPLSVALDGNRAFIGATFGTAGIDAVRGEVRFVHRTPGTRDVIVHAERIVAVESGEIVARNRSDGERVWSVAPPDGEPARPAVLLDGSIVAGAGPRAVREVSPSGKLRWRFRVGASAARRAVELARPSRDVAFVSREGVLYRVSRGGSMTGRVVLPSRPYADPAVFGRLILVPCFEDEVVAVDPVAGRIVGRARFPGGFLTPPVRVGRFLVAVVANPTRLVGLALASGGD